MDREQFWHLYVNTNSLAELAIVELGRELDAAGCAGAAALPLSEEEIAARLAAQSRKLDFSALDGLDWDPLGATADGLSDPSRVAPQPMWETPGDSECNDPADIDAYLNRVYAQEEILRPRVDAVFARIDMLAAQSHLARLPAAPARLTTRLTGEQLAHWLAVYRAGDPGLENLVTALRGATLEDSALAPW